MKLQNLTNAKSWLRTAKQILETVKEEADEYHKNYPTTQEIGKEIQTEIDKIEIIEQKMHLMWKQHVDPNIEGGCYMRIP